MVGASGETEKRRHQFSFIDGCEIVELMKRFEELEGTIVPEREERYVIRDVFVGREGGRGYAVFDLSSFSFLVDLGPRRHVNIPKLDIYVVIK